MITGMSLTSTVAAEPAVRARILIAEDCADTRLLLQMILADDDIDLAFARDGEECLKLAAEAAAEGEKFDLILLDVCMPEPDGYTVARILRSWGFKNPIISMSASCLPGQPEESVESGCTRHIAKSGMHHTLPALVDELLAPQGLAA